MHSELEMKFHHLGVVAQDLGRTLSFIKDNFEVIEVSEIVHDQNQTATLQLVKTQDLTIELISGKIVEKLSRKNITYYHLCYSVKDIEAAIKNFKEALLISPPKEAKLYGNNKVAFLMTPIGIIELLEEK